MIPLGPPDVRPEDVAAVREVLTTERLSRGPAEARFEARAARAAGAAHAVAVNSGTSGLQLALRALAPERGAEVVTTPYSFVASANALLHEGLEPVFVDIDPGTLSPPADAMDAAVTSRTAAFLPVHVYGRPYPAAELRHLARRRGLPVVEDACEAIGTRIGDDAAGSFGDLAVLSFYPNKQVTTGEGGVVVTSDAALAERLRLLRNQGRVFAEDGFDQVELGFSYRLPEMSCALGASQLDRLEEVVTRRAAIAAAYDERLRELEGVTTLPLEEPGRRVSWFVYVVFVPDSPEGELRDRIMGGLRAAGIECARYFLPIHLQPLYRERFGYRGGEFPIAERAGRTCLALPFFHRITEEQIDRVVETLGATLAAERRGAPTASSRRGR